MPKLLQAARINETSKLGINLFDIDRVDAMVRANLLTGRLILEPIRLDSDRPDETLVEFKCPLLSAACICDTLRAHDRRAGDYPTRVYIRHRTTWERIPADALLTLVENQRVVLNPKLFGRDQAEIDLDELAPS